MVPHLLFSSSLVSSVPASSALYQVNSKQDQMPYGTTGLDPFPVEIWRYIFTLVEEPVQYSVNGAQTYQYFFSEEDESHLWDLEASMDQSVFQTRLSIVLACRSWYYMGLPILWSHLFLRGNAIDNSIEYILEVLKRDTGLGCWVTRLSIIWLQECSKIPVEGIVMQILPLLTRLSVVNCPVQLLERFPPSFRANTIFIRAAHPFEEVSPNIVPRTSLDNVAWRHCQILTLASPLNALEYATNESHILFPNLISLRLCITEPSIFQWIVSTWHLPALKNFSMTIPSPPDARRGITDITLAPLLRRVSLNVERIQIPVMFLLSTQTENAVVLPQLQEIHLLNMYEVNMDVFQKVYQIIKAPKLRRFIFYAYSQRPLTENYWDRINAMATWCGTLFPSVKAVDIIATRGEWVAPRHYMPYELVIKIESIIDLIVSCNVIRVIAGTKGVLETFTRDKPGNSQEKLEWSARLVIKEIPREMD